MKIKSDKILQRRIRHKLFLVKLLGGQCQKCGYKKCLSALTFHHKDPKNKSFNISGFTTNSLKKLIEEVQKCELLCHNCHTETHAQSYFFDIMTNEDILDKIETATRYHKCKKCIACGKKTKGLKFCSDLCKYKFKEKSSSFDYILKELESSKSFDEVAKKLYITKGSLIYKVKKYNKETYNMFRIKFKNEQIGICPRCSDPIIRKKQIKGFCSRFCYIQNKKEIKIEKRLSFLNKVKETGYVRKNKKLSDDSVISLFLQHKNYTKVAKILNCSGNAIKKRLKSIRPEIVEQFNQSNKIKYKKRNCLICKKLFYDWNKKIKCCSNKCSTINRSTNYNNNINKILKLQKKSLNKSEIARKLKLGRKSVEAYIKKHENEAKIPI